MSLITFEDWYASHTGSTLTDNLTTQSQFSTQYTAWLTYVFNDPAVRTWIQQTFGVTYPTTVTGAMAGSW
jgi:hypothetical protein